MYQHITDLPLSRFISCLVDGNLTALVLSGLPTQDEITAAWEAIEAEYVDAIGEGERRVEMTLFAEIQVLSATYSMVLLLIERMREAYHPEFARMLNSLLRINFKFDPADPEKYYALLSNCYNRSKGVKIDLDLKTIQYQEIDKKAKTDKEKQPYTREYFQVILISLSDHAQYQISENITVFEFCNRISRLNKYNAAIQKQQENVRRAHR